MARTVQYSTCSICFRQAIALKNAARITNLHPTSFRYLSSSIAIRSATSSGAGPSPSSSSTFDSASTSSPKSTFDTSSLPKSSSPNRTSPTPAESAQKHLNTLLQTLDQLARKQSASVKEKVKAWELERRLREMGGKINAATGYEEIDLLRKGVAEREKALVASREVAGLSKQAFAAAVAVRATSQKEVNDLLQRKNSWTSADVVRFTELIQQDHENEQAEVKARIAAEQTEQEVEHGFSDLMQAILQRYHEEQVWSDKIRSLSTYGSLAITSLNVLLFIVTILLVEPWKRRRLVEGVEARLRETTSEGQEATLASLVSLQSLLTDAQEKLDRLVTTTPDVHAEPIFSSTTPDSSPSATGTLSQLHEAEEFESTSYTESLTDHNSSDTDDTAEETVPRSTDHSFLGSWYKEYHLKEDDWRMLAFGGVGVAAGVCLSATAHLLFR